MYSRLGVLGSSTFRSSLPMPSPYPITTDLLYNNTIRGGRPIRGEIPHPLRILVLLPICFWSILSEHDSKDFILPLLLSPLLGGLLSELLVFNPGHCFTSAPRVLTPAHGGWDSTLLRANKLAVLPHPRGRIVPWSDMEGMILLAINPLSPSK